MGIDEVIEIKPTAPVEVTVTDKVDNPFTTIQVTKVFLAKLKELKAKEGQGSIKTEKYLSMKLGI
jgi:uncharacterized protein YhfF